ncbi:hypothetical protein D3C75_333030 [compost metagenome]
MTYNPDFYKAEVARRNAEPVIVEPQIVGAFGINPMKPSSNGYNPLCFAWRESKPAALKPRKRTRPSHYSYLVKEMFQGWQ